MLPDPCIPDSNHCSLMFPPQRRMKTLLPGTTFWAARRGKLIQMQSAAQLRPMPTVPGLSLVESEAQPFIQVVGISAAWRKLLLQAEMAAPHLQVATIEGEHGTGKHTLGALSFSPLAPVFVQLSTPRCAEWLAH